MAVLIRNLLINAQRFRLIAGQTRRIPCHFHSLQLSLQRTQLKADLKQDHLDSLQVRVGEIIGNAEADLKKIGLGNLETLRITVREINRTQAQECDDDREDPYLTDLSKPLEKVVSTWDKQRRRYVFKALDSLISHTAPEQAELFKESLLSQIHGQAVCLLVFQAIAARVSPCT